MSTLTLPATPKQYTIKQVSVNALSQNPFTGQSQVYSWPGEWWEIEVTFPQGDRASNASLVGMLTALRGKSGTFYFGPYGKDAIPMGVASGTPVVSGAGQSGASSIVTTGWTVSTTGILKAGDWIQIGSHLHRVLYDANSDSSGNATLSIFPSVRSDVADGTSIVTSSPKGIFRMKDDFNYSFGIGSIYEEISISGIEYLS